MWAGAAVSVSPRLTALVRGRIPERRTATPSCQGQFGRRLAGLQPEISARKLEICNPTLVSEPGMKRPVKCHGNDGRNYGPR